MTSEEEKQLLVLAGVVRTGGSGTKERVLDEIAKSGLIALSNHDLKIRPTRNELNWRNDLAYVRSKLARQGFLGSSWNSWAITERGREHLATLLREALKQKSFRHIRDDALPELVTSVEFQALSDDSALSGDSTSLEGAQVRRWVTTYERNAVLRSQAIQIHGVRCMACRFDFESRYGALGSGFIEVHHTQPVSSLGGEIEVNPKTDLVVLCSNCHSMVHRKKGEPLTIEALRKELRET